MKMIYLSMVGLLLSTLPLSAQEKEYKGYIHVTPLRLEQEGDSLYIRILYDISGVNVNSRHSLSLSPSLVAPHKAQALPEVMVKGRNNYKAYIRRVALMNAKAREKHNEKAPYAVVKGYQPSGASVIEYSQVLPYESWMDNARLDMREDWCGCGQLPRTMVVSQLVKEVERKGAINPYPFIPLLAYVRPEIEAVKRRDVTYEVFLDFVVNQVQILPDYMNNSYELTKLTDIISEIQRNPYLSVNRISVIGYASPEGTLAGNRLLSEGRAQAMVNYLLSRFDYPDSLYRVQFGGENWQGLREKLEQSDFSFKEAAIEIIDRIPAEINYKTHTSRKKSLMDMQGGVPYLTMQKELFPSLRKAICKIDYVVADFDLEEAREMFGKRPQDLSLNEMFLIANTYESGSQEFIDIFETAARIYPNDPTASLNAASAALARRDVVSAERHLSKVHFQTFVPEYDNALGVLAMLKGDYSQGEAHFKKAADAGLKAARLNLREAAGKRESIENSQKQKR